MAKKRRRDRSLITTTLGPPDFVVPRFSRPVSLSPLGDLRRYDFERATRPAYSFGARSASRLVVSRARAGRSGVPIGSVPIGVAFADPRKVAICRRREVRRQVLHAAGVAGGRVRKPRRNAWSSISCK